MNHLFDGPFLGSIQNFPLPVIARSFMVVLRGLIHDQLAKLVCKKQLPRREKPHSSTYLHAFALDEPLQIQLFPELGLRPFKKLVSLRRPQSLKNTLEKAHWLELLVFAKVCNQILQQVLPLLVVLRIKVLRFEFF